MNDEIDLSTSEAPAPPEREGERRPRPKKGPPLRKKAIQGSALTMFSEAASQGLRVAGNLVLTRLLFPEAFGLMALVRVVIRGVEMFSDVGLRGSIIFDKRGKDPEFLNTAWTLQILRGVFLWIVVALLAAPSAWFYDEPDLVWLIPVVGFGSLIRGFGSTARHSLTREVSLGRIVTLDLTAQVVGVIAMIAMALVWRSVWPLVLGGLLAGLVAMFGSHRLIPGYSNRFAFDRGAALSMFRFGRWITVSVMITFLIDQGDKLVLGKMITAAELGVYSIAAVFARIVTRAVAKLSFSVLQPVFSRLHEQGVAAFRRHMFRMRAVILGCTLPVIWVLGVFGDHIIGILYDERYSEAGWMVRIIAVGAVGQTVSLSAERVILSRGDSFNWMILQVWRLVLLVLGVGGSLYFGEGIRALLIGLAIVRIADYVPLALSLRRFDAWLPWLDLTAFAASAVVLGLGAVFV